MGRELASWAVDRPVTSPFALPSGRLGRLAGRFMRWTNRQDDVVPVLDVRPGQRVLEVGFGPGGLLRLLVRRTGAAVIHGVDPSPDMCEMAGRANRAAVRAGRVRLATGTADRTGLADGCVDRVVAVNNVALWPDLEAGLTELRRVTDAGGAVVLAWHGGTAPGRIARGLRLPPDKLDRIHRGLAERFDSVTRRQLSTLDVFVATAD
jgi:SAM-dependent methyltransferase